MPPSLSEMTPDTKPMSSSFAEIKGSLDPACSYLVFEKAIGYGDTKEFQEITEVLSQLKERVLEREVHRDETTGLILLVVKLDPEREDKTMEEFLEIGLPEDITWYYYGKRINSRD